MDTGVVVAGSPVAPFGECVCAHIQFVPSNYLLHTLLGLCFSVSVIIPAALETFRFLSFLFFSSRILKRETPPLSLSPFSLPLSLSLILDAALRGG